MSETNRRCCVASLALLLFCVSCASTPRKVAAGGPAKSSTVVSGEGAGSQWLVDTARSASSAGAGELQVVAFGSGGPGDAVEAFVFVPKGRCALIYARGSSTVEDLDLLSYGDDGTEYGVDEAPDDLPTLVVCPAKDTRLYLAARVALGRGLVAVGMQDLPAELAAQVARAVGARSYPGEPTEVEEAWPGLVAALSGRRQEMGGRWTDQRRVALPVDARLPTQLTVKVPKGGCLDVLVLPGEGVAQLSLTASDQQGRLFARDDDRRQHPALLLCAGAHEESVALEIRPRAGRGLAVAALSVLSDESSRQDLSPKVFSHFLGPEEEGTSSFALNLPHARKEKRMDLRVGEIESWETRLDGCARLDLLPQLGLVGVAVRVWSQEGSLLAEEQAGWHAPLFFCSQRGIRIDSEAVSHNGTLRLELRTDKKRQAAYLQLPLAASRLMARAHAQGALQMPGDLSEVERLPLSDSKIVRRKLRIKAGHCRRVMAARQGNGYGLEVRLFEAEGSVEMGMSRGAQSVQVQACAGSGASTALTVEFRSIRGNAELLWTSFQESL